MDEGGADDRCEPVRLPGSSASTLKVASLLNSLPRLLLKTKSGFQGFLQSLVQSPSLRQQTTSTSSSTTWPMPLPYPEVFMSGSHSSVPNSHLRRLVCLQIAAFDWLVLGCPGGSPSELRLGGKLAASQWSVVRMLEHLVVDRNTPEFILAGDMGRTASKVEDLEEHLAALSRAFNELHDFDGGYFVEKLTRPETLSEDERFRCGSIVGRTTKEATIAAKPLISERLRFPAEPSFNPLPFFDESTSLRYQQPRSAGREPGEVDHAPPPVHIRADRKNKLEVLRMLADSGRLKPIEPDSYYPGYTSGMFAVGKDQERDRLILDGRPANMLDLGQSKWSQGMANAAAVSLIFLQDERNLVVCGEDLRDFFYQFQVNSERTRRNALCDTLTEDEARHVFGAVPEGLLSDGRVHIGFSSLAMGDICAVEYAQCSHFGILLQSNVCKASELMTLRGSVPRGLLQVGIIVDDLIVLEQVLKSACDGQEKLECQRRTERARSAYASVGLESNPKKAIDRETCCRFWGIEIDGVKGLCRCSSMRLWPVIAITLRVTRLGLATIGLLETLAGSWVSLLSVRRRLYSLLDEVFDALSVEDQKAVVRLSDSLTSELQLLCILGPLAVVNLRAKAAPFIAATDASMSYTAAVRAPCPDRISEELFRHVVRKGIWTKLLGPRDAWDRMHGLLEDGGDAPDPSQQYTSHPLWQVMSRGLRYEECWRKQVKKPHHINVLELRAFLTEERRLSRSYQSLRVPHGIDSQVCIGAVVKGRTSSRALNQELRRSMCWPIGSDIYNGCMYFESAHNRADAPTRHADPPPPDIDLPAWWEKSAEGDHTLLDNWLLDVGAPDESSGLPFDEVSGLDLEDLKPQSQWKKTQRRRNASSRPVPERGKVACNSAEIIQVVQGVFAEEAREILQSFDAGQFLLPEGVDCLDCKGGLDLYSGSFGVAKAMLRAGAPWILTFEIKRSFKEDLLDTALQQKILRLVELRVFGTAFAAPICSSFSVAITPPVRSSRYPRGKPGLRVSMRTKVSQGNRHSDFISEMVEAAEISDTVYGVENPDTSWLWRQRKWRRFYSTDHNDVFRLCFCRFGTAWKKPTRIATNSKLRGCKMWCRCVKPHIQLRGMHPTRRVAWTHVAEPYPRGLNKLIATALCSFYGWCKDGRLDVAGCSKLGTLRVGEAMNPGPVSRGSLEEVEILSFATRQLEARQLRLFLEWCGKYITATSLNTLFDAVPAFLVQCLRTYGDLMYQNGGALSNLRHLLLACQKWKPMCRPLMTEAWDIVARWEHQQPVSHRPPVPESMVRAMCAVAWNYGWYTWVAATLISFYGAGRPGEVLRCLRSDLVLPEDLLEPEDGPIFLKLRRFKSLGRQPARIQHMKITECSARKILKMVFSGVPMDRPLFNTTPYQYRKRWNMVLATLVGRCSCPLTPGGLRGGSAVFHYRNGVAIADLMWLMRLRSQSTLEFYLQEVAAMNVLATLTPTARSNVSLMASIYPFLAAG